MNKVITINLGGNAYQLEEGGYDALRSYLDAAHRRLEGNPDRDEIIADIERAIADKFRSLLGVSKTVVVTSEVTTIIAEMGPVEDGSGSAAAEDARKPADGAQAEPAAAAPGAAPKRLYKIHEGAMAGGVCTGLAAYFNIDVTIVRVLFAVLIFAYGTGILLYLLMAIILPSATTAAEKAAAHGTPSTTAQEFIRRAREGYYEGMKTMGDRQAHRAWRRRFKADMREWRKTFKRQVHFGAHSWWHAWEHPAAQRPPPPGAWFVVPFAGFLLGVVTLAGLCAIYSLAMTGALFGLSLPAGMSVPVGVVLLVAIICVVRWPLKEMRRFYYGGYGVHCGGPLGFLWHLAVWVGIGYFVYWLLLEGHPGRLHEAIEHLPPKLHHAATSLKQWWDQL